VRRYAIAVLVLLVGVAWARPADASTTVRVDTTYVLVVPGIGEHVPDQGVSLGPALAGATVKRWYGPPSGAPCFAQGYDVLFTEVDGSALYGRYFVRSTEPGCPDTTIPTRLPFTVLYGSGRWDGATGSGSITPIGNVAKVGVSVTLP
jgi:hypothetical protein